MLHAGTERCDVFSSPGRSASVASLSDQLLEQRRKVDFDSYDITVQQLIAMVGSRSLNMAPAYQREFRWDIPRQSKLIESVFLGIPIPSLFMAANSDATWECVDGVQRLCTLIHFAGSADVRATLHMRDELTLAGLERLSALNGLRFQELAGPIQLQFSLRPIKVTTLSDKSDLIVRFDLFERLNTGGVRLTNQEIRACIFRGRFNDFLQKMANDEHFKKVVVLPEAKETDGTREEYVLRFFAFLHKYRSFEHSVVSFLNDFMKEALSDFAYAKNERVFVDTFRALKKVFPEGIIRARKTTPVNLFEAVSVGAAKAMKANAVLKKTDYKKWLSSPELVKATTGATNTRANVVARIEYCARQFGWQ